MVATRIWTPKVESLVGTRRSELLDVENYATRAAASPWGSSCAAFGVDTSVDHCPSKRDELNLSGAIVMQPGGPRRTASGGRPSSGPSRLTHIGESSTLAHVTEVPRELPILSPLASRSPRAPEELERIASELTTAVGRLDRLVRCLAALDPAPRAQAESALGDAYRVALLLREHVVAIENEAQLPRTTSTEDRIAQAVEALRASAGQRARLADLLDELTKGSLSRAAVWRQPPLEEARSGARAEVNAAIGGSDERYLPERPQHADGWVAWYLEDPDTAGPALVSWKALLKLLMMLRPGEWTWPTVAPTVMSEDPALGQARPGNSAESVVQTIEATDQEASSFGLSSAPGAEVPQTRSAEGGDDPVCDAGTLAAPPDDDASSGRSERPSSEAIRCDRDLSPHSQPDPSSTEKTALEPTSSGPSRPASRPEAVSWSPFNPTQWPHYRDEHWLDVDGNAASAPWKAETFVLSLADALTNAVVGEEWAKALLFARAGDTLSRNELLRPEEVELAAGLATGNWPPSFEAIEPLLAALHLDVESASIAASCRDRVRGLLLVLCSPPMPRWADVLDMLELSQRRFWDALVDASMHPSFIERLGLWLDTRPRAQIVETFAAAQRKLKERLVQYHNAAGGRIQRTHCRKAWSAWIVVAKPLLTDIAETQDHLLRDDDWLAELLELQTEATRIFDDGSALRQDRGIMDRAVEELVRLARDVLAGAASLSVDQAALARSDWLLGVLREPEEHLGTREEVAVASWIARLARRERSVSPRTISEETLRAYPALLAAFPRGVDQGGELPLTSCDQPLLAAAHLLHGHREVDSLRTFLRSQRPDLLDRLALLDDNEQATATKARESLREELESQISHLELIEQRLGMLADPEGPKLRETAGELRRLAEAGSHGVNRLQRAWAAEVVRAAQARLDESVRNALRVAVEAGHELNHVETLAREQRYGELAALAFGRSVSLALEAEARATAFRGEARKLYPSPRQALRGLHAPDPAVQDLLATWLKAAGSGGLGPTDDQAQKLREDFIEVVFSLQSEKRKTRLRKLKDVYRVDCDDLRDWLAKELGESTPTFAPQLRRCRDVAVRTLPPKTSESLLPSKVAGYAEEGSIVVVLAPGLSDSARESIRRQLLGSSVGLRVALIDDLDLCRLLRPDGLRPPPVTAFVELVLEQLALKTNSPYVVQEGQNIELEMYVGRHAEAESLVTQARYSRIFSGRRLGKTALIRYLEQRSATRRRRTNEDDASSRTLASGNELRVLYVPIVGIESEREVVNAIASAFGASGGVDAIDSGHEPGASLELLVRRILDGSPTTSWLVFLDEADTFFEGQLRLQERSLKEDSLSWRMRSLEVHKDGRGLPRVRFVVCGYRATGRSDGAWGNWGEALELNPLETSDAVDLVVRPFARIGVDVRRQARTIALRCMNQPAIIIRFCVALVEHLVRKSPLARDHLVVQDRDVERVFQEATVQDTVREVCWLNFVGNPSAQLVFAAFLQVARSCPPGQPIEDAPERMLREIKEAVGDHLSEKLRDASWPELASNKLRELRRRALLEEVERIPSSYALRYPHQLPILVQEDPRTQIRDAVARLDGPENRGRFMGLIPGEIIEHVHWLTREVAREYGLERLVVASHWVEPLRDRQTGLAQLVCRPVHWADTLADVGDQDLVIGGASLLREALRDTTCDVVRLGRVSREALDGHLRRTRGIELSANGALDEVMKRTSGIPLLLAELEQILLTDHGTGATIDRDALRRALDELDRRTPSLAMTLVSGGLAHKLHSRELEILRLVSHACRDYTGADVRAMLSAQDLIDLMPETKGLMVVTDADLPSISLLLHLGLLRRDPDGGTADAIEEVEGLDSGDAVFRILAHLSPS